MLVTSFPLISFEGMMTSIAFYFETKSLNTPLLMSASSFFHSPPALVLNSTFLVRFSVPSED